MAFDGASGAGHGGLPQRFASGFGWRVGWRLALLALLLAACAWSLSPRALPATAAVLGAAALLLARGLWHEVQRTNLELSRLLQALAHDDGSARFDGGARDAGFSELAGALHELLQGQRERANALHASHAQLLAVLEHVPTPLLAVDADERVTLLNHAARRLFKPRQGQRVADLAAYGPGLVQALRAPSAPVSVELCPADDAAVRVRLAQSHALYEGRPQRLVALQPIQADLDHAEAELSAGLVRVLTHEVMNSLTPVTSLLQSSAQLAGQLPATGPAALLQSSLNTAARRALGLMAFVESYRDVARIAHAQPAPIAAAALVASLQALFVAEWPASKVLLSVELPDQPLQLHADRNLIEPMLLNLLRNAAQAAVGHAARPQVLLRLQRTASARTLIDIEDNGPGIALALRQEVFLPFFTTKPGGHGVGLSLARQAVLAHGGAIRIEDASTLGGACLRLVL